LRQPIESGAAVIARQCPCALSGPVPAGRGDESLPLRALIDPAQSCGRAPKCATDYQARISGPLFDRIDIHVEVASASAADLSLPPPAEGSSDVATRVAKACDVQRARYAEAGLRTNAEAEGELLDSVATPDAAGETPDGRRTCTPDRARLSSDCCAGADDCGSGRRQIQIRASPKRSSSPYRQRGMMET
jgi:magnesium chelatase family protein